MNLFSFLLSQYLEVQSMFCFEKLPDSPLGGCPILYSHRAVWDSGPVSSPVFAVTNLFNINHFDVCIVISHCGVFFLKDFI